MEKTKLMPKKQPASKCCCHTVNEDKPAGNEGGLHIVAGKYMFHKFVKELFAGDPEVTVGEYCDKTDSFTITVSELYKANVINTVMGGVNTEWDANVFVSVKTAGRYTVGTPDKPWHTFFRKNANCDRIITIKTLGADLDVVVFKPKLVQIACDSAFNPEGLATYTFEQVAVKAIHNARQATFTTAKIK